MMTRTWIALGTLALLSIAGCPDPGDNTNGNTNGNGNENENGGSGGATLLTGRWSGTLSCEVTQFVGDTPGSPSDSTVNFTIEFDEDGLPEEVTVLGFADGEDQTADLKRVGDTATLTDTVGSGSSALTVTRMVRVTRALYTTNSARITLDIDYTGNGGNLQQTGGGTQTIEVTASGSNVTYNASVEYDVQQTAGTINLDTGETTDCEGTLTKQ